MRYSASKLSKIFSASENLLSAEEILEAVKNNGLPMPPAGSKSWTVDQVPRLGEKLGYLHRPLRPQVFCFFVTKGGVLKSSLTLNFARILALHNIKTCVVGLDMQGDITTSLGYDLNLESDLDLEEALQRIGSVRGLPDLFYGNVELNEIVLPTELPSLYFIPETPELVSLERNLTYRNRREFWLKDFVVDPLKEQFDVILLDGPPNWNQLITNALVSCDHLISPLECKINNFRNFKMFETFIKDFQRDLKLQLNHMFIPTRLNPNRKLSREINDWYHDNLTGCVVGAIRESTQGEEATAMHLSVAEYAPSSQAALEMKDIVAQVWKSAEATINGLDKTLQSHSHPSQQEQTNTIEGGL
ncbi:MAG: ParA family protein [Pseudobdellovibrionaceae bacterium]|nr:ParA family protein [Bdellovibrionales bacterium]USN48560.1 MAG: ParA family protein [Pseudobdellovibrionaceae bacterium]